LEDAQSARTEVDRKVEELQKANASLRLQIDKWQKLEKKDDEELEDMRQKRLEVEAQVQKLQARLHEFEASPPKDINVLEGRVRKLTSALEKYVVSSSLLTAVLIVELTLSYRAKQGKASNVIRCSKKN